MKKEYLHPYCIVTKVRCIENILADNVSTIAQVQDAWDINNMNPDDGFG